MDGDLGDKYNPSAPASTFGENEDESAPLISQDNQNSKDKPQMNIHNQAVGQVAQWQPQYSYMQQAQYNQQLQNGPVQATMTPIQGPINAVMLTPMNPMQPPMNPMQPTMNPFQPPMNPMQPTTIQPPMNPMQPPMNPMQPTMNSIQLPMNPIQPPMNTMQPPMNPMQPIINSVQPPLEPPMQDAMQPPIQTQSVSKGKPQMDQGETELEVPKNVEIDPREDEAKLGARKKIPNEGDKTKDSRPRPAMFSQTTAIVIDENGMREMINDALKQARKVSILTEGLTENQSLMIKRSFDLLSDKLTLIQSKKCSKEVRFPVEELTKDIGKKIEQIGRENRKKIDGSICGIYAILLFGFVFVLSLLSVNLVFAIKASKNHRW